MPRPWVSLSVSPGPAAVLRLFSDCFSLWISSGSLKKRRTLPLVHCVLHSGPHTPVTRLPF